MMVWTPRWITQLRSPEISSLSACSAAQDAALAVEHDLVGERDPLVEVRLLKLEAAGAGAY